MSLPSGARLGHYEILGVLGSGGMGDVYRARDTKLNRVVALKMMRSSVVDDPESIERFEREAHLLASLNHPNIAQIHGREDAGGVFALVLELVEGPTLADRIAGGAMPLDVALPIAVQVASALEAAHEQDIVHRDLKPANIKLRVDGMVKVLDFGIAKVLGPPTNGNDGQGTTLVELTQEGTLLGTCAYMSPEQVRGRAVDKRADIWAFGCVFYEMLTGRAAFRGDTPADTLARVLEREPEWAALPAETSPVVRRLLSLCLEKDASRRLRDIGQARIDLGEASTTTKGASAGRTARTSVTVAVLPFQNLSSDPEQGYLSDGLTEETITALGTVNPAGIRVVARTSSMAYRHTTKTASQIGHDLRADYLLESSVRREAAHIRIVTQLIRVEDETQVWSERYDRTPVSLLGLQDEIGRAIADQVQNKLSPRQPERPVRQSTRDPEAYDLYLQGKYSWNHFQLPRAIERFEAAVAKDPSYARAFAGLAEGYSNLPILTDAVPREYWTKAQSAVERSLALDPDLSEAHAAAGFIAFFLGWDWPAAERSLRRAIELNANNALAFFQCGHVLSNSFRHDEALALIRKGQELDPLSPMMHSFEGQYLFDARRYQEALQPIRRAIAIAPAFFHGHEILSRVHLQLGDLDGALAECEKTYELSGGMLFAFARKGYVLAAAGRRAEAEQVLATLETMSAKRFVSPFQFALVHAGLCHRDQTLDYLEHAFEARAVHLVLLPTDPVWDSFRDEPRLRALVKAHHFPERP